MKGRGWGAYFHRNVPRLSRFKRITGKSCSAFLFYDFPCGVECLGQVCGIPLSVGWRGCGTLQRSVVARWLAGWLAVGVARRGKATVAFGGVAGVAWRGVASPRFPGTGYEHEGTRGKKQWRGAATIAGGGCEMRQ
ncbi:hypothetical protein E2C01_017456 [Portunus trituberculatus]|uniref:Uncharacterized protein n=1 Tax=Portunus trituberculatus TaxID=210409 RepID=A0A5B7DSX3_PORTR|nr:hypothetical protein [Portunus trituberculatus]